VVGRVRDFVEVEADRFTLVRERDELVLDRLTFDFSLGVLAVDRFRLVRLEVELRYLVREVLLVLDDSDRFDEVVDRL